jgi:fermentation-respiration switch protein FrsA (DUF1100 family)
MFRCVSRVLFGLTLLCAASAWAVPQKGLEGIWLGTLKIQETDLRLVVRVSWSPDSNLVGLLDSPDQGAKDVPVDEVGFENGRVRFGIKVAEAVYEGLMNAAGDEIEGEWQQMGMKIPLIFKHTDTAPGLSRPQEAISPPLPYDEELITYGNIRADVVLAGTLTMPREGGPFPVVILITGSGPQDRDETVFGHRPFFVLADYLARLGIAVLRVDDRGVGNSTGDFGAATSQDFAHDAEAAVAYVSSRKDIDKKRIGLLGHSEGALIADMIAARNPAIAFVVSLSGPSIPGGPLIAAQAEAISRVEGMPDSVIAKNGALRERMFEITRAEPDSLKAAQKLRAVLAELSPESLKDSSQEMASMQIRQLLSPWFRFFLTYDPAADLARITCPYLAVMGEKDLQVPPESNRAAYEAAFKASGNKKASMVRLPGLNHLMQTATTGSPTEYMRIEETFAPAALKTIGDWILLQTGKKK